MLSAPDPMTAALASLHPDLQDLVGRTIADRYRVDALIGTGGMGAVFRGHHLGLHRDVAIKVLHPSLTRDPEISSRFDREARSASRLDHPNCLQVTDFGTTEHDMKFMVMQLLDGSELTPMLGRPLGAVRALELALQVCKGLEHAHSQAVIHRDVKPENIFVTRDHDGRETLKLVDFGIAKLAGSGGSDAHKTRVGLIFGTPAYMSPEQAAGVEADERADLYSLGIILYEMISGRPPFQADDPVALVRMQVGADPPPLPTDVPPMVAAIVERCLAKQRDDRFSSARELRDVLEGALVMLRGDTSGSGAIQLAAASLGSGRIPVGMSANSTMVPSFSSATPAPTMPPRVGRLPRRRVAIGAGAAAIGIATLWLVGDEPTEAQGTAAVAAQTEPSVALRGVPGVAAADDRVEVITTAGPDASALSEIDRLLMSEKLDEADKLLAALRDQYPRDPQLSWRLGRLLTKRKNKRPQALLSYGDAIEVDPALLDNNEFYAELHELLRTPSARDEALDLALHHMGRYAHGFLLEMVNSEKKPLTYAKRHRALVELETDPDNLGMINRRLNTALDLLQAHQSLTPCQSYSDALTAIAATPEYYYLPRVERATPPLPVAAAAPSGREDPAKCDGLEAKRQETISLLAGLQPMPGDAEEEIVIEDDGGTAPAPAPAPAPASKPAGSKPAGSKPKAKKVDCSKLRGVFKKKCWK